ncbi:MAG: DegT/DnrJ/EryC1/StrS family aminotransferase [Hyphomicrobiaceae bacterium]
MIDVRVIASALRVLSSGEFGRYHVSSVSEVERFERDMQNFLDVKHVLGVNSGTSALICALVGSGIGPGDEVIVPAYTWVATAAAPLAVGAVPVLAEINQTLTIDPEDIRRKISPHTKAIIVVHMLNLVCDMDAILAIAKEHNLIVIEDACQAVGVTYRGRRCGTMGDAGAFSFNVQKNMQAGEGGAVLTNSPRTFTRALTYHDVGSYIRAGRGDSNEPPFIGQNYRMTNLAAAILRPQISRLDKKLKRRRDRRKYWLDKLSGPFGNGMKVSPHNDPESAVAISVHFDDPEAARAFGSQRGISRLIDTDRHIYTNWRSISGGVPVHPKMDPYNWAKRDVRIRHDSCPKTLKILERTCEIRLFPEVPTIVYRQLVGKTKR